MFKSLVCQKKKQEQTSTMLKNTASALFFKGLLQKILIIVLMQRICQNHLLKLLLFSFIWFHLSYLHSFRLVCLPFLHYYVQGTSTA